MTPRKLKNDAIIEAVFEVRFQSSELPEVVVGRLADRDEWSSFSKMQLPIANVPGNVRRSDLNLRFEPLVQLQSPSNDRLVRIGEQAVSYHIVAPYCGWSAFRSELQSLVAWLSGRLQAFKVIRLGLRYIDALRSDIHSIAGLSSLNLRISVGTKDIDEKFMLHFVETPSAQHSQIIRITSKSLVEGPVPDGTTVITDIDVFTPDGFGEASNSAIMKWTDEAHDFNKSSFFNLLPTTILTALTEA